MALLTCRVPPNVSLVSRHPRPLLTTSEGGRVALDSFLRSLWEYAGQRELTGILTAFQNRQMDPLAVRAVVACLAEAGLLLRENGAVTVTDNVAVNGDLVSVVIVAYNSQDWLPDCLASISSQTYSPLEIIVVDNGSQNTGGDNNPSLWPHLKLIRLSETRTFAAALNVGITSAAADSILILNPDTRLEPDAIAQMVTVAQSDPTCAAVAAKLKFMWAPHFLNGLGNHVGAFSWGLDNGSGHLDLGQFDTWSEIPSACFAAALIARRAWEKVGRLDEEYALYYEDSDWCYRARLLGYHVRAAPQAVVYHAFGSKLPVNDHKMNAEKLQHVVNGRLRFAFKIPGRFLAARFIAANLIEDGCGLLFGILRLDGRSVWAYWTGWSRLVRSLPTLMKERRAIQQRRVLSDREIFDLQKQIPIPLTWRGMPELTWDLVKEIYLPLILAGKTRSLPEFAGIPLTVTNRPSAISMLYWVWRSGGWRYLLHRIGRNLQWRLARV